MALVLADRVKETTTTTGTGTVTLAGASVGFQSFAAIGNANTTFYCIAGQTTSEWEVGIGTYTSVGTTLARTTVLASSNSNLAVTFSAGTKDVFVTYPSGKSVNQDASGNVGIGTTSPLNKLNVITSSTSTSVLGSYANIPLLLKNTSSTNNNWSIVGTQDAAGNFATFFGTQTTNQASALSDFVVGTNPGTGATERMRIDSSGNVGIGTSSPVTALSVSGAFSFTAVASAPAVGSSFFAPAANTLAFGTASTERMRIDSSGNVGIGTSSPIAKLNVKQTNNTAIGSLLGVSSSADDSTLYMGYRSDIGGMIMSPSYTTTGSFQPIIFRTSDTNRMTIDTSGNVGIGTTSGNEKLNVAGAIGASSSSASFTAGLERAFMDYDGTSARFGHLNGASGSAKPITFFTGGSEKMRLSAAGGLGVGTTTDPGAGAIYATGNITAYFSDDRLKTRFGNIENALAKVKSLDGFYYEANQTAQDLGYKPVREAGVSAQQVQAVLPEVVKPAPIDPQYLTVDYERLVPLLIEAVKELSGKVEELEAKLKGI